MTDDVAIVADGIATCLIWLMLLSLWRWNRCEIINDVATVADGIATYVDSWCYCYYSDEARSVGLVKACVPA